MQKALISPIEFNTQYVRQRFVITSRKFKDLTLQRFVIISRKFQGFNI